MADILENIAKNMRYISAKQAVIAGNISKANIPNAKALTLEEPKPNNKPTSFKKLQMSVSSARHIDGKGPNKEFKIIKRKDTLDNSFNGNNINLVEETEKMSEAAMDLKIMTEAYKKINSLYKTSISTK